MKVIKKSAIKSTISLLALALASSTTMAQELSITVTNLTQGLHFTPVVTAAHMSDNHLFMAGEMASIELQAMAEGGDISSLVSMLSNSDANINENPAAGLLAPAMSASFSLSNDSANTHLSHDLRTPLATMQGYIETLAIKGADLSNTEQQEYLATVQRNVTQLKRLIDQIFELAHLENGQVTVNLETFAIGELLHDILAKFTLTAADKKISLLLRPQPCQFMVYSDIAKLERIMTNLLENALRHTAMGGEIVMTVEQLTSQIKVSVTDNGSGISKEDIAYIFDARYRASNAIEDNIQHTGLGLAISQKLSQVLNSELMVKSELGYGSSFSLSLPTLKP
ncbi:ATP-binding protein [Colwellia piezophila]|uniref:ATP-binding protein n=1 Tax=Colwellia piezophila TaxID=211668 RepID=UPI0003AA87CC|nr:ATP-binding protein [Colwellia piezophila]